MPTRNEKDYKASDTLNNITTSTQDRDSEKELQVHYVSTVMELVELVFSNPGSIRESKESREESLIDENTDRDSTRNRGFVSVSAPHSVKQIEAHKISFPLLSSL